MREIIPHDHPVTKNDWKKFHAWRNGNAGSDTTTQEAEGNPGEQHDLVRQKNERRKRLALVELQREGSGQGSAHAG